MFNSSVSGHKTGFRRPTEKYDHSTDTGESEENGGIYTVMIGGGGKPEDELKKLKKEKKN